jgi:hypothetical protein
MLLVRQYGGFPDPEGVGQSRSLRNSNYRVVVVRGCSTSTDIVS